MLDAGPHFDKFAALLGLNPSPVPPELHYHHVPVTLTAWRSAESLQLQQKTVDLYESLARGRLRTAAALRSAQNNLHATRSGLWFMASPRDCMALRQKYFTALCGFSLSLFCNYFTASPVTTVQE